MPHYSKWALFKKRTEPLLLPLHGPHHHLAKKLWYLMRSNVSLNTLGNITVGYQMKLVYLSSLIVAYSLYFAYYFEAFSSIAFLTKNFQFYSLSI